MKRTSILTVLLVLFMFGCSDDADPVEAVEDAATTADVSDDSDDAGTTTAASWAPAMYRVTEVNITEPSTVGGILNSVVNPELRDNNIHILIETTEFAADSGATTLMIRGDAGALLEDGTYEFSGTSEPQTGTVDESGNFTNDSAILLNFPVRFAVPPVCDGGPCDDGRCRDENDCRLGFTCDTEGEGECNQDVVIPLHEVIINGTFIDEDDTPVLRQSTLDGVILKEEADVLEVDLGGNLVTLTSILRENQMDWPEDSDDPTGWILSAQINADAVNR